MVAIREQLAKAFRDTANAWTHIGRGELMQTDSKTRVNGSRAAFGDRFAAIMAKAGLGTPSLISDALEHKWTKRQVSYLYAADYKSVTDAKETTPLLKACADLAGVTVDSFFSDEPVQAVKKEEAPSELLGMVTKALDGPKAEFLADAIEMAYAAAVTSKSNYRHR
jgi:hypothetical protein